ncbi:hypothetical protein SAMN05660199_00173 [Klenkia soli]|uniref:Uncharacterized protein n=1 Tax=Klenkia soli TaxID=1052260 RepID=A0A1H0C0R3_9ACTN|nr:hypothetical protein [Klenkia soli]SDN51498.1 hypothetical protein SAMN05660199_00173 [Klenkia soli]
MLSWSAIYGRLGADRRRDLDLVEQEARNAETEVADLENAVRRGDDVEPGQVEAAEARGRHVRLRLDGVAAKHDRVLHEAQMGWAREVHAAATALDDEVVFGAVDGVAEALALLIKVVPDWNERFTVVLDAARQVPAELGVDVGEVHGALRIEGRSKRRVDLSQLVHQALYDAVGGDLTRLAGSEFQNKAQAAHNTRLTFKDSARAGI